MGTAGICQSSSIAPDSSKAKSATASIFKMLDKKSKIDPSDESGTTSLALKKDKFMGANTSIRIWRGW